MKKLLLLGGSRYLVPVIREAISRTTTRIRFRTSTTT